MKLNHCAAPQVSALFSIGGTILKSARSQEFKDKEGRAAAIANLEKHKIDALVVIGGDGSLTGALALQKKAFQ